MISRILIVSQLCALAALAVWQIERPVTLAAAIAESLGGERWYRLDLDGQQLGFWRTSSGRDERGDWVFETEQHFALIADEPLSMVTRQRFSRRPPHRLLAADQYRTRGDAAAGVRILAAPGAYLAVREPEDGVASIERIELAYTLADYLEFELWLAAERPAPGRSRTVMALDFDRAGLVRRSFDVVERNAAGYLVEHAAPQQPTRTQLDARFAPETIRIAGLFELTRASRAQALAPRSTLQSAAFFVPADRPLTDHTRISRLVLAVSGSDSPRRLFRAARRQGGQWQLVLTADATSNRAVDAADLSPTLDFPSRHPDVERLAADIVRGLEDDLAKARALTRFVHEFLSYQPDIPSRGVLTVLEDPRGDCTEFADLLTTLARTVGLPSRTVFGLAYSDNTGPAFAYHAWNELFIDGSWRAMDPTWNQDRVDATHIPLPASSAAVLQLLTGSVDLAFSVMEVEHFDN